VSRPDILMAMLGSLFAGVTLGAILAERCLGRGYEATVDSALAVTSEKP
jgi:hypothetical protein